MHGALVSSAVRRVRRRSCFSSNQPRPDTSPPAPHCSPSLAAHPAPRLARTSQPYALPAPAPARPPRREAHPAHTCSFRRPPARASALHSDPDGLSCSDCADFTPPLTSSSCLLIFFGHAALDSSPSLRSVPHRFPHRCRCPSLARAVARAVADARQSPVASPIPSLSHLACRASRQSVLLASRIASRMTLPVAPLRAALPSLLSPVLARLLPSSLACLCLVCPRSPRHTPYNPFARHGLQYHTRTHKFCVYDSQCMCM